MESEPVESLDIYVVDGAGSIESAVGEAAGNTICTNANEQGQTYIVFPSSYEMSMEPRTTIELDKPMTAPERLDKTTRSAVKDIQDDDRYEEVVELLAPYSPHMSENARWPSEGFEAMFDSIPAEVNDGYIELMKQVKAIIFIAYKD